MDPEPISAPIPGTLLAKVIGISSDAVICIDAEQRIIFFNKGAERIFGYTAGEVMGRSLELLLPERSRAVHARHVEQFGRSSDQARAMAERQEIMGRRKNGEEFPAEAAIAKLRDGDAVTASVVLRDVSDRKRAENRQRLLLDAAKALSASVDLDETKRQLVRLWIPTFGDVAVFETWHRDAVVHVRAHAGAGGAVAVSEIAVTPGVAAPRGVDAGVSGDLVTVVEPGVALAELLVSDRAVAAAITPTSALVVSLVRGGRSVGRISLFACRPLTLDAEDLALARDLAGRAAVALENARLHDDLMRAIRARDDTMNVVSHDLRNPLSAVKMLASALLRRPADSPLRPDVEAQVAVIQSAVGQMDSLIQDLMDMGRVERGRFPLDLQRVSCREVLANALRTLGPLAESKRVSLDADVADGLPEVEADPERLTQVLSNVVGNAIKFTPAGGEIRITVRGGADAIQFTVTDSGAGIPAEQLLHVFDRYWQSSVRRDGVGLGLPIAKAIVEAHGGRIWAERVAGRGAVFHFTLPV